MFNFKFPQQGNVVTHHIARHVSYFLVWIKDIPAHLNDVILANLADI